MSSSSSSSAYYRVSHVRRYHFMEPYTGLTPGGVPVISVGPRFHQPPTVRPAQPSDTEHPLTHLAFFLHPLDDADDSSRLCCYTAIEGSHALLDSLVDGMQVRGSVEGGKLKDLSVVDAPLTP